MRLIGLVAMLMFRAAREFERLQHRQEWRGVSFPNRVALIRLQTGKGLTDSRGRPPDLDTRYRAGLAQPDLLPER